jgi:peptidoglycan/LPS O-acetylase OafA/YrhL
MDQEEHIKATRPPVYFGALDGFRGVLAIMIAIYHTMWRTHFNNSDLFTNGPVLVDMFFVFSGFLMFYLYRNVIKTREDGVRFIKRRIARIYPLHFFMLLVFVAYAVARIFAHVIGLAAYEPGEILPFQAGAAENLRSFLTHLTLTHSMGLNNELSFNAPSWTVSVEFWAYFVFLAMLLWARPSKAWHFGVISVLIAGLYFWLSQIKPDMNFHYDYGFFRCLGGFFTGVVGAFLYTVFKPIIAKGREGLSASSFNIFALALEIMALGIMVVFVVFFPGKAQFFIAPVALFFVVSFAFDAGPLSRFMSLRPLQYIARISYSIYMVHVLISNFFWIFAERIMPGIAGPNWNAHQIGGDLLLIPYLGVVIFVAHHTYKWVEMPGRRAIIAYDFRAKISGLLSKQSIRKT